MNEIGFDGLELSLDALGGLEATSDQITELRKELEDHGAPCAVVKGGGGLHHYRVAAENRAKLEKAVEVAAWIGAETVNTGAGGYTDPRLGPDRGGRVSYGSSAQATEEDFVRTATGLREVGEMAGANGLNITIEVHQHSIADNSSSALHILDLADSPYVHANPDLGNILWTYETPDETPEEAILALAPRSKYWHCKNLRRIQPEVEHSYFVRVPLPERHRLQAPCTSWTWTDSPYVHANPDLGNILWTYETPDETPDRYHAARPNRAYAIDIHSYPVAFGAALEVLALQEPAPHPRARGGALVLRSRAAAGRRQ